jgi:hypothetical protein
LLVCCWRQAQSSSSFGCGSSGGGSGVVRGGLSLGCGRNFVLGAVDTLVRCREVLVWTYAWAFFETDPAVRELFEHSQKVRFRSPRATRVWVGRSCMGV